MGACQLSLSGSGGSHHRRPVPHAPSALSCCLPAASLRPQMCRVGCPDTKIGAFALAGRLFDALRCCLNRSLIESSLQYSMGE